MAIFHMAVFFYAYFIIDNYIELFLTKFIFEDVQVHLSLSLF